MPGQLAKHTQWWKKVSIILTPKRQSYAKLTGIILWLGWLVSIFLGSGNFDLANQVVGTDYLQFYTSGTTLARNAAKQLYDFSYQAQLEVEIIGPGLKYFHAFLTPPFLAWLFSPLSTLPYLWSFALWSGASLLMLFASLRLLNPINSWSKLLWALCWFPVFASITFGQNSLLSLLLLSMTCFLWQRQRNFSAGLIASLIIYKPQLLIGVFFLWLIRWRRDWKALLGLLTGTSILVSLTFLLLPDAAMDYVQLAMDYLPGMIYNKQFPLYHLHALRSFWILLFPGQIWLAESAALLISLASLVYFYRFIQKNRNNLALQYSAAVCLTILITPHAMIYDWVLLLIPALLLWQAFPDQKPYWAVVFAAIWMITLLSGPLTYLQQKILPIAIQISVPIYLLLLGDISCSVLKETPRTTSKTPPMPFESRV